MIRGGFQAWWLKPGPGVWHVGEANIPEHCRMLESVKCFSQPRTHPVQAGMAALNKAGLLLGSLVLSKGEVGEGASTNVY